MPDAVDSNAVENREVPEGYKRMPEGLGFGDQLQPFYRRVEGRDISLGLFVTPRHSNIMGICHGGALMTLADIAAGTAVNMARETPGPAPTINLTFDFQSPGRAGQWLHTHTDRVELKRRFGFVSGVVLDGDTVVLRYSGTFYLPSQDSKFKAHEGAMAKLIGENAAE